MDVQRVGYHKLPGEKKYQTFKWLHSRNDSSDYKSPISAKKSRRRKIMLDKWI